MNNIVILIIGVLVIIIGTWAITHLKSRKMIVKNNETNQHLVKLISWLEAEIKTKDNENTQLKEDIEKNQIAIEEKEREISSLRDSYHLLQNQYQKLESSYESLKGQNDYYAEVEILSIFSATIAMMDRFPEKNEDLLARINQQLVKMDCSVVEYSEKTRYLYQTFRHNSEISLLEKIAITRKSNGELIIPGIIYLPNN